MSKKVFTGEKQNLPQLVKDVEDWLRRQGFEVQSSAGDGNFLVQARMQSTWRSLLGNNQSIDVKIEGKPESYSIDVDAGAWVKNLASGGGWQAYVAVHATILSFGLTTAWSATERAKIEADLWALKDASCPGCYRLGAAEGTGEKFVRAEGITLQPSGVYQGTKVFTDTFKCKSCSHAWDRGEKPRQATLCPKCYDEKALVSTGKKLITCKKTEHRSQQGQPVGEQVFTNTFRCNACAHGWDDGEHSQLVEVCPGCLKAGTRETTGEKVISCTVTDQWSEKGQPLGNLVFTNNFRCQACPQTWDDGQHARLVEVCPHCKKVSAGVYLGDVVVDRITKYETKTVPDIHTRPHQRGDGIEGLLTGQVHSETTYRLMQFAIAYEVFTQNYKCNLCAHEWSNGQKTRRI